MSDQAKLERVARRAVLGGCDSSSSRPAKLCGLPTFAVWATAPFSIAIILILTLTVGLAHAQSKSRDLLTRAIALEESGVTMEALTTYDDYLKKEPGDASARARLIGLLIKLNKRQEAIQHIAILRKLDPTNAQYKSFFAIEDDYRLNVEEAQDQDYKAKIKAGTATASTYLEYSKFLSGRGDEKGSREMLRKYLELKPSDFDAQLSLAKRYSWAKQSQESQRHAIAAVNLSPDNVEANSLLGDLYFWQGNEDEALNHYQRASRNAPNNRELKAKVSKIIDAPGYRERRMVEALAKEPDSKVALDLAKYYLDHNREWEADSLVDRRIAKVPDDQDAIKLSQEIEKKKHERYAKQIKEYRNKLSTAPRDTTLLLALARYYVSVPSLDSALQIYDRFMKIYPSNYDIRMERAKVLMWNDRSGEASAEFRVISIAQPDNVEASLALAECLIMNDVNIEEAENIFRRELIVHPTQIRPRIGYADALRREGRYDEAQEQYKAVLAIEPDNERAIIGLEWINRDLTPLLRRLENQVAKNPKDSKARRRLAGLYYDAKRYWDAEQQVNILLADNPDDSQLKSFLEDIKTRSKAYRSAGLDSLQHDVAEQPENSTLRRKLADELAALGRNDDALYQYNMLLQQNPESAELKLKIVDIYLAQGKMKEASVVMRELADNNPGNFDFRFRLAQILSWMGDYDGATQEYETATRINPNSVECQLAMADIAKWRGDPYTAYDMYGRVLALNPSNATARKSIEELKGTLVRGVQGSIQEAKDSERFYMRETRASLSVNLSLRMRAQGGFGKIHFQQNDALSSALFSETGWFLFGQIDYRIDPLTRASGQIKYYTFALKKSQGLRLEIEHDFKDFPNLIGMTGTAYYTSQEAVLDLASTKNLMSWTDKLKSEKLGASVSYIYSPKWLGEGEIALIAVSDGNTRTDIWGEWRRVLSKLIQIGARYENISAKRTAIQYWSPNSYQTISLVAQMQNSFNKWGYKIHGGVGRVLSTSDALRNFSAQVQWRIAPAIYFSAGLLDLATTRIDGRYWYRGVSASLTLER